MVAPPSREHRGSVFSATSSADMRAIAGRWGLWVGGGGGGGFGGVRAFFFPSS